MSELPSPATGSEDRPTPLSERLTLMRAQWINLFPTQLDVLAACAAQAAELESSSKEQEMGTKCIHFPACGCGGSGLVDSACWPQATARSEKPTTVTPEQMCSDRLEGAKALLKEAQLKTRDVFLQAKIHNFLTGGKP